MRCDRTFARGWFSPRIFSSWLKNLLTLPPCVRYSDPVNWDETPHSGKGVRVVKIQFSDGSGEKMTVATLGEAAEVVRRRYEFGDRIVSDDVADRVFFWATEAARARGFEPLAIAAPMGR